MKIVLYVWTIVGVLSACLANEVEIQLQEAVGRNWPESVVVKRVEATPGVLTTNNLVVTEGDKLYATQLGDILRHADGSLKSADVWFRTDLKPSADRTLVLRALRDGEKEPTSDLGFTEVENGVLELRNGLTAVRVPGPKSGSTLPATAGPILGVQLASGVWTGATTWLPPEGTGEGSRAVEIVKIGSIILQVRMTYTLNNGGYYVCDVTLRAGEQVVRIDERYEQAGRVSFALGGEGAPTQVASESNSRGAVKVVDLSYQEEQTLVSLAGWDLYFGDRAHAIELRNEASGDMLGIVSTDSDWLPNPNDQLLSLVAEPEKTLTLSGPLMDGHRHWGLVAGTQEAFPEVGLAMQRWWCQEVVLPLEKVATWQLIWPRMMEIEFPHTFFGRDDLAGIRQKLQASEPVRAYMNTLIGESRGKLWGQKSGQAKRRSEEQLAAFDTYAEAYQKRGGIAAPVSYQAAAYLYNGEAVFLDQLADTSETGANSALSILDKIIDIYRTGVGPLEKGGGWAHMGMSDQLMLHYLAWEFLLASDRLSVEEKRSALSKLAFCVYLMHEAEWQPAIHMPDGSVPVGYPQGTANMKNCALSARVITGCLLSNHPALPAWIDFALKEITPHMEWTVHPSGAMLESPFYTSRDTIRYVPFWTALTRAGVSPDTPALERVGKGFSYLVDMLTPPEPRLGNRRVYHPLGRSSTGVIDPTFIIGSQPWGASDPEHGQRMRWAWEEQGRPSPDRMQMTGGRNIGLTLIGMVNMLAFEKPEQAPLRSRRYEGFGVIMRGGVDSDYESNLMFRHDPFAWDLYPPNNGAVYLYAKGVPMLPRLGGYWQTQKKQVTGMSAPFGNRLLYGAGDQTGLGKTTGYALMGDVADYSAGITADGHWERQVLFSKDMSRYDGLYLLVRDDVRKRAKGSAVHWWILSKDVQPNGVESPGVVGMKYPGGDKEWMATMGKNWAMHATKVNAALAEGQERVPMPPALTGPRLHFEGHFGVNLEMYIAAPTKHSIVTDALGIGPRLVYNVNPKMYEFHQLVRVEAEEDATTQSFLTLLTPQLSGAKPPEYTTIADGRGVQVVTPTEQVWLFLGDKAFSFADDDVTFAGQSGSCRVAEKRLRLTIQNGQVTARGVTLKADGHAALLLDVDRAVLWADDPKSVGLTAVGRWADRVKAEVKQVAVDAQ